MALPPAPTSSARRSTRPSAARGCSRIDDTPVPHIDAPHRLLCGHERPGHGRARGTAQLHASGHGGADGVAWEVQDRRRQDVAHFAAPGLLCNNQFNFIASKV